MKPKPLINILLRPFGWIFGSACFFRRLLYRTNILKSRDTKVCTINVGNIAVGGTGKTPHSQYIIDFLNNYFNVAFLSRGYGRKTKGYLSAKNDSSGNINAQTIGDEPFMIRSKFPQIALAVDENRFEGISNLSSENPDLEVIVLDDAFQHLKLKKDLNILLTDYSNPYCNDHPMPAGRLREFPSAAQYANIIIVTKIPDDFAFDEKLWRDKLNVRQNQNLFFTKIKHGNLIPVTRSAKKSDSETKNIILFTGIANPEPLICHLEKKHSVTHIKFPDHHNFEKNDFKKIVDLYKTSDRQIIATTEKDWARLQTKSCFNGIEFIVDKDQKKIIETEAIEKLPIFVIPVEIEFYDDKQKNIFNEILKDYVYRKKKKNIANS